MQTTYARRTEWVADAFRVATWIGHGLFVSLALLILVRRIGGEFSGPLPAAAVVSCLGLAAAGALGLRQAERAARWLGPRWTAQIVQWLPTVALFVLFGALWLPDTEWWGLAIAAGIVCGEEFAAWRFSRRGLVPPRLSPVPIPLLIERETPLLSVDDKLLANLTCTLSAAGERLWRGSLRVEMLAGQRTAIAHVAFCPAFERVPTVAAEQIDGPPADIRVGQVLPQGARFEVRAEREATSTTAVLIEFIADESKG